MKIKAINASTDDVEVFDSIEDFIHYLNEWDSNYYYSLEESP